MDQERHEVFERIPWESLERSGGDKNRLVMVVAGAVAVGALAFSFMRSQPVEPAPPVTPPVGDQAAPPTISHIPVAPVATPPSLIAEADLFAIDHDVLREQASSHAEWLAVEYFTVDGSDPAAGPLGSLLPAGVPMPEAPEGLQVYVDWVRTTSVTETGPLSFRVEVLVRSLLSTSQSGFVRQPSQLVTVDVAIGEDGLPRVVAPPLVTEAPMPAQHDMGLVSPPDELRAQVEATHGPVVGGTLLGDGRWRIVAVVTDPAGVARPVAVDLP